MWIERAVVLESALDRERAHVHESTVLGERAIPAREHHVGRASQHIREHHSFGASRTREVNRVVRASQWNERAPRRLSEPTVLEGTTWTERTIDP